MKVSRGTLILGFGVVVVLFLVAAPFGGDHHGVGLVLSDVLWTMFLISVPVFLVLCAVATVSAVAGRRRSPA